MKESLAIRIAGQADLAIWHTLRCELWPGDDAGHLHELEAYFRGERPELGTALLANMNGTVAGFAEVAVRPFAEGCSTRNVGFLEGWYVRPSARGKGVGRALICAVEDWARSRGCKEFASDTEVENTDSYKAHLACGFEDAGLIRCFRKDL